MIDRRHFLTSAAGAAAFGAALLTRADLAAQEVPRRRALHEMGEGDPDLETFRDFVEVMRRRDAQQGVVNWETLAAVHSRLCPHGNWFFLPWHRAYLRMYEQAARDVTGNAAFAMPYWDWTASPDFPRAFAERTVAGRPNPLHIEGRAVGRGSRMDTATVGRRVIDRVLATRAFETFASSRPFGQDSTHPRWIQARGSSQLLEATPHDLCHVTIGGWMAGMSSPRDPVFLMHHGNVDRIWAEWNARGGVNTRERIWTDMVFNNHFWRTDGTVYSERVADTQVPEAMGYSFGLGPAAAGMPVSAADEAIVAVAAGDAAGAGIGRFRQSVPLPAPATPERAASLAFSVNDGALSRLLGGAEVSAEALRGGGGDALGGAGAQNIGSLLGADGGAAEPAPAPGGAAEARVVAVLRRIAVSAPEGTALRLFVNRPDATGATPTEDPHFAGQIGFFGILPNGGCRPGEAPPTAALDITETLEGLRRAGRLSGPVTLQIIAAGLESGAGGGPGTVCPAEVELAVV